MTRQAAACSVDRPTTSNALTVVPAPEVTPATGDTCDLQMVRGIAAGREQGLRDAMAAHGPAVLGMARRVVLDPATAEEVAQDTFVALWKAWDRVDLGRGSLRSFLLGIARHKAIDRVRSNEARSRATAALQVDTSEGIDNAEASILTRAELVGALKRLSKVQREALVLAYFGGRTYREVAQELGVPEGTAKSRINDGLRALRRDMAVAGRTLAFPGGV